MLALGSDRRRAVGLGQPVGVGELETDPRHALDHRRRGRSTCHHAAHPLRETLAQRGFRVDQQVVHDWGGAVVIHSMRAHGIENCAALHLAQTHLRAGQHRDRPREAPAVAVEQRQRPQVGRKLRHAPGGGVAHRVEIGPAVVRDHALGIAGGAGGIGHGDGIPFVPRTLEPLQRLVPCEQRLVLVGAQRLPAPRVLAVAHVDDDGCASMLIAQDPQRRPDDGRELAVGDQHRGLAVLHLPGKERCVQARIERVEHGIQRRHRVVRLDHLRSIGQHGADRGATRHPEGPQRRRQSRRAFARVAPAVAAPAMNHRGQIAEHLGAALHEAHRRERHVVGGVLVQVLVVNAHGGVLSERSRGGSVCSVHPHPRLGMPHGSD